jgi:tetratricopeptide (TPR) repeat protein
MTIIPLRAYNSEIEGLIDNGQLDEAVAHCRHILVTYPKYIATYRLLGKAHLEQQRISDATDIFQRVLSSIPDDFIANVGMSIIREDENNLDAAIWHMELAYESQPANVAIQDELRRLYGRRDGMQPPKVRLTRGALARMYAKGGLFDQSIAELRAAISEDPNRHDLQLLLAEMYYQTSQRVEAVETCANIIKKIPYCLQANRILAISLSEAEGSKAVKNYQQTVISLDPYFAYASPEAISSDQVPENTVNIERLDWKSGIQVSEAPPQPDWATSLGISIEKPADENLPDWLAAAEAPAPSPTGEKVPPSVSPFIWDNQEVEKVITETSKPEGEIPDWMKDAGWQPATGEATPPPGEIIPEEPLAELPGNEDIEQAEMPEWLRGIAPESVMGEEPPAAPQAEADLSTPWLDQHQPGPTDSIIQWLDENKPDTNIIPPAQDEELAAALDEEIPDWLKDIDVPQTPSIEEEGPAESPPGPAVSTPAFVEEPSALESPQPESPVVEQTIEQSQQLTPPETEVPPSATLSASFEMPSAETEGMPPSEAEAPKMEATLPAEPTTTSPFEAPEREETLPAEFATMLPSESFESEELPAEAEEELPDWLKQLAEEQLSPQALTTETEEELVEIPPVDMEPEMKPAATIEETPSVEQPVTAEGVPASEVFIEPPGPQELEMPVSISEQATPEAPSISEEVPQAETPVSVEKVPVSEVPSPVEQQAQPEVPGPSEEELAITEPGLAQEPESEDWLERLRPEQETIEEDLVAPSEGAEFSTPEWLNLEAEPSLEATFQPEAPGKPGEEMPEWIKGLGEEPEVEAAVEQPEVEAAVEQPEVEAAVEQPEVEAAVEQPEVEAAVEQPEVEAAVEQPEVEAVIEQPEVEAAVEQPEVEAVIEQPEVEAVVEQPEVEAVVKQPEVEAAVEQPEAEAVVEQPEVEAAVEQPEVEAAVEQPVQEVAPQAEIPPTEELPAWLLELEEPQAEEEPAESPEQPLELKAEELPTWLQEITEAEPAAEAPPVATSAEVEPAIAPVEETPQPVEEILPAMEIGKEALPEELAELASWVPEVEVPVPPQAAVPVEAEVPAPSPIEEQLPQAAQLEVAQPEVPPSTPQALGEQNQKALSDARSSIDQGQPSQAVESYAGLIKQNYQLDEIIKDLTDAVYRYPVDAEMWVILGDAYFRKDQLQEALNAYNKAEELAR